MQTDCYFSASDQNADIPITFSDPQFLKESNNFVIRRRFLTVTLTFDTLPRTFVVDLVLRDQTLNEI